MRKITQPNFFLEKSGKLFKFVSLLLSASVERVGVSHIRDFFLRNNIVCHFGVPDNQIVLHIRHAIVIYCYHNIDISKLCEIGVMPKKIF